MTDEYCLQGHRDLGSRDRPAEQPRRDVRDSIERLGGQRPPRIARTIHDRIACDPPEEMPNEYH